jgi:hypothetical protein
MEKNLFILLRLGLGTSTLEKENISDLLLYSEEQWLALRDLTRVQGVLAIVMDGIDKLVSNGHKIKISLTASQKLEWIGEVLHGIELGNQHQLSVIKDLQEQWSKESIRMLVMKGQAMGVFYPNPIHRCPGDIDCYLFDGYAKGNELAKSFANKVDEGWYKHSVITYKGETIENHQYFVHTREGRSIKRLNQILVDMLKDASFETLPETGALLPPTMFNAVFLTYHALAHFLEEGLKLKQILDWAMFLKQDADKVDWKEFYRICDEFHFRRFANVMNDIAVNYLGVKLNNVNITFSSPYTEKVLHSTLYDKDYVFGSGKGDWTNRWHIVRNMFKYRWKYHKIYQHSILRQMWFYVVGFVFKSE